MATSYNPKLPQWWTYSKADPRFTMEGPLYFNSDPRYRRKKRGQEAIDFLMKKRAKELNAEIPTDLVWGTSE